MCEVVKVRQKPGSNNSFNRALLKYATIGTAVALLAGCSKFEDSPGLSKNQFGRAVNSISAVIAGITAQKVATNSNFQLVIVKPGWYDAKVTGTTSATSIDSSVDLDLTTARPN